MLPPVLDFTSPTPWGLRWLAKLSVGCGWALHALLIVAEEKQHWGLTAPCDDDVVLCAFRSRLQNWPLATLARAATALRATRCFVRQFADSTRPPPAGRARPRYRRLYNICLWQRRHPLFILTAALDAFGESLRCEELDAMLEALTQRLAGPLSRISHIVRCDVLMAYGAEPFAEQLRLMEAFQWGCAPSGGGAADAESRAAPPPALFLSGPAERSAPPRFGDGDLEATQYAELRAAFEAHKRLGVKRLLSSLAGG